MSVRRHWPTYLLTRMPGELRARIHMEAVSNKESLAEVIRGALCTHYELRCDTVKSTSPPQAPLDGTETMLLRLQPELYRAIRRDSDESGESMRTLILRALEDHYEEEKVA